MTNLKLSEQVRRLEDTIESLKRDNKELRDKLKKQEPRLNYKWNINSFYDLPSEWNEEWDFYTYKIYDKVLDERCVWKYVRYKNKWIDLDRVIESEADDKDEVIDRLQHDLQSYKDELATYQKKTKLLVEHNDKLTTELSARLKQVEDLQSSFKVLQEENKRLKSKLEQTVDEYDEDYQTFHRDEDKCFDENFRKIFWEFLWHN